MTAALQRLYRPQSIAVVGASARPESLSAKTLSNLIASKFQGRVYPVNPRHEEVAGLPCYASLEAIPIPVDLALILVPAAEAESVVRSCAAARVGAAVIFTSGFAELGKEGLDAQAELVAIARTGGTRLLGPNCQGFFYQSSGVVATFSAAASSELRPASGVAYIGQSGAMGGSFLGLAGERGIGVAAWFSVGNQADVTVTELGLELLEDEQIRVLALHLESLPNGVEWSTLVERARSYERCLVVLRSGRSAEGRKAAASHTGAMIACDAGFELMCRRAGVVTVSDIDEFVGAVAEILRGRLPKGKRMGVLSSSGGAGALAADHLALAGLDLAKLDPTTTEMLSSLIPRYGSSINPVDVTAQLFAQADDAFGTACAVVAADPNVDALIVVLTNVAGLQATQAAQAICRVSSEMTKPISVAWLAARDQALEARESLAHARIVVYDSVRGPIQTMAHLFATNYGSSAEDIPEPRHRNLRDDLPAGTSLVTEWYGAQLLDRIEIPHPRQELVNSAEGATIAARRIGGEIVLKVQSPEVLHKSDNGGVRVGVEWKHAARVYSEICESVRIAVPSAQIEGVLVQECVASGLELLLGIEGSEHGYPPIVSVGLGGIATEVFADVVSELAPLGPRMAQDMLRRLRSWPLLAGHRGGPAADVDAVVRALVSLSEAAIELDGTLRELEINPLIVYEHGICAIDFMLRFD